MPDLELTRAQGERHLYVLHGVGKLRLGGLAARTAIAEAGERSWRIERRRLRERGIQATDAAGTPVGVFEQGGMRRGGTLRWDRRELTLRPSSRWRERYMLVDGDRELAVLDGRGWGKRPVKMTVEQPAAIEPGLLLFAAFVVRRLAAGAAAAAGVAASAVGS